MERDRGIGFSIAVLIDNFSTIWGDGGFIPFGRHRIHPRGGKMIVIETPQGRNLQIRENDILHLVENGVVLSRFTSKKLPEGYKIRYHHKGV